jgi:hypothetical protein
VPAALLLANSAYACIFISLSYLKAYNRPDHSIRIVEYDRKNMPKTSSTGIELRKIFGFVAFIFVIPSPKHTTFILAPFFYHAYFQATE